MLYDTILLGIMQDHRGISATVSRTSDVVPSQATSFHDLCIPRRIVHALSRSGYSRPSPIQEKAIPLTRLGVNVMIQAKAGTGKTLVFAVAAAERIDANDARPQALLIAPTREIALQASNTVRDVASSCGMSIVACIGGLPTSEDERVLRKGCHVVVGTPGRILSLIERGSLNLDALKILVLDEADRLMEDVFFDGMKEICCHIHGCPQILALSATFQDKDLVERLESLQGVDQRFFHVYMEDDLRDDGGVSTSLLGVIHYYFDASRDPALSEPMQQLNYIFERIAFRQCIIFCPTRKECVDLTEKLLESSYAAGFLSSEIGQIDRIRVLNDLRQYKTRILVCTDVAARGIDLPNVDLVCNLGCLPHDASTLAHRIGRAGRFGTQGVAVTVIHSEKDLQSLEHMVEIARGSPVVSFEEHEATCLERSIEHATRSVACVRIGQLSTKESPEASGRKEDQSWNQEYLDIIMNASLWNIGDAVLGEYGTPGQEDASHIDLVLQSIQQDLECTTHTLIERDSLEILSDAFSKILQGHMHPEDGMLGHARHTRSLGSIQSEAVLERRNQEIVYPGLIGTGRSTLEQEADILERMWDEAMIQEGQTT